MKNFFTYLGFFALCLMVGVLVILCVLEPSNAKLLALLFAFFGLTYLMFILLNDKKPN